MKNQPSTKIPEVNPYVCIRIMMTKKMLFDEWPERYDQWFTTPIGKMVKEIEAIKSIVHAINKCWRLKDYEGIGSYLADDVVIAPPQSDERIRGSAAYVKSYRNYDQLAELAKKHIVFIGM